VAVEHLESLSKIKNQWLIYKIERQESKAMNDEEIVIRIAPEKNLEELLIII